MNIDVRPLTPGRWPDVEAIFNARGCGVARGCWCVFYRHTGRSPPRPPGVTLGELRRRELEGLAAEDPPPGLIGYRSGTPVGWISLGPREVFRRFERSPIRKPVDDQPVWSIICFVVPGQYRRQGVSRALLAGAIEYARARGVECLEAYPAEPEGDAADDTLFWGVRSLYDDAGFVEVARRRPNRPIVRLSLRRP